ncbi:jg8436 [Pararge aegeria aegeria]|uniref:Jg8436 protein n=1 Tax=Pararge aegeria aegeria TaxID=348720 RepID=A0A8S4SI66_9NEOP|nr:jg8436 [Pararge aegeria aegeria]
MHDTIVRLADVWKTCNKIRAAAFRVGLNLWDWYRPLDPEGNSLISESKFVSVLAGPLRSVLGLSDAEVAQVADYFRAQDGRVLYHQLCQIIHGEVIDTTLPKLVRPEIDAGIPAAKLGPSDVFHPALEPPKPTRNLLDLMMRVQEFVLQRRIRVSEFFRDYDPLNCGRIAPQQFRRALDAIGLGSIMTNSEALCILRHYVDPNDPERVCWRTFEDDCDQVFAIKELEKHPNVLAGAAAEAVAELPPRGSAAERGGQPEYEVDLAQTALLRVRAACKERSIDLRPSFGEHDEHNNGHVSRAQVRRVLARLGVLPAPAQLRALEQRYLDDCGFSYVALLEELEERPVESATIAGPSVAMRKPQVRTAFDLRETDIVQILAKIKGKMVRDGLRPRDFISQFDKQRELVVPRPDFYRGLATAGLALTPLEMDTLMEVFCAPGRRRYIEYERFCATVDEALTQSGLERAPLLEPVPHIPTVDSPLNYLNFEERNVVAGALAKLAKFPDQLSNILEVFKDSDKQRCGTIPRVSVERALCQRGLLSLLSARERDLIYKCFGYRRGCGEENNQRRVEGDTHTDIAHTQTHRGSSNADGDTDTAIYS